ncbi:GDNF family receptor alpha-4-like isoform 2-T2 [Anomaloglossus baeobatrachus]|uniref:GDNF family receptor alpha-4-like isoform X2 n=1 Tax=Anomaloglossus baeobatrachus TaxID=238106 RepID=UPI003F4F6595
MKGLGVILLLMKAAAFSLSFNPLEQNDCISAEVLCKNDTLCNNTYLVLKNCSRTDGVYLLNAPECQEASQRISQTPIIHCKCHHRMKKEELCLNIYWTVHYAYMPGNLVSYDSPYADELKSKDEMTYPQIFTEPFNDGPNACLNKAAICSSNEKCTQLKNEYVIHCSVTKAEGSCDRRKCHYHLRNFIKKIPMELTKQLLFCPCYQDTSCGERRRKNIVPKCSFEEREKKNCLQLYDSCMSDNLCKSRLLDYQKHCHLSEKKKEGCSVEQYDPCIKSYIRLIGTTITPNFINNSSMDTSLWCTCEGSGNKLEDCNVFLGMFTSNRCLQKAIIPDLNHSIIMTINDDQRSRIDDKGSRHFAIHPDKKEKIMSSEASSGVCAPSFTLLSPALFLWLLKVISFM